MHSRHISEGLVDTERQIRRRDDNNTNPHTNKHRALSPTPKFSISDSFEEVRSDPKRFSTPQPQRVKREEEYKGKPIVRRKSMLDLRSPSTCIPPPRRFSSAKLFDKRIRKRESSWSKLFDCVGGKVTSADLDDDWLVDLSKLFLGVRFASGAHSQLYHGVYKDETVAVKVIRVPEQDENKQLGVRLENQFIREVAFLSRLHHRNVIKFIAAYRQPPAFCVITEYLSKGSLRGYLHKLENHDVDDKESLSLKMIVKMALDVARGMEYIHSQGIIHRDLKPDNILLSKDLLLKVADFGIGCEESNCDAVSDDPGTYRWMAPELIKRKSYGRKVDVYGFGLILWEMMARSLPYKDMTPIQAAFAVVHKKSRPPIPPECPPAMRTLIELCWSSNQRKRPEFSQVVKVLEEFETVLVCDGNLYLLQYPASLEKKKNNRQVLQKLDSYHHQMNSATPKPRFS